MRAHCALPARRSVAYAACPVLTVLERKPRNSKTRLRAGPAIFGDAGPKTPIWIDWRHPDSPKSLNFARPFWACAGNVRPNAASSRVAPAIRGA